MKLWAWIKSIGWIAAIGTVLTAVLFAMAGINAGRHQRRAKKAEAKIEQLHHDKTKVAIDKAAKMQKQVETSKLKVADAHKAMLNNLEKLGTKNEDIDIIADRFNSKRMRRSAD